MQICKHINVRDIQGDPQTADEQTAICNDCGINLYRLIDDVLYLAYLGWDGEHDTLIIGRKNDTNSDGWNKAIWATRWNKETPDRERRK